MRKILFIPSLIFIILIGCTMNETKDSSSPNDVDMTKLSTKQSINQDISNHTKDRLKKYDEIKSIVAVNTKKKLVVGVRVQHRSRFHLKSLRKKWKSKMEKAYPKMDVKVTTDKKIIWELGDLEKKLKETSISKKKLQKELKRIIKLMNKNA